MGYAVEMFFDEQTENKIRGYFKLLFDLGLSKTIYEIGTRPHISLAVYNEVDTDKFTEKLGVFLKDKEPLKLQFVSIGIFPTQPSTVFLTPHSSNQLLKFHCDYHDIMDEFLTTEWGYYLPNNWDPHCTIAIEAPKQKAADIVNEILKDFNQFHFHVEKIGIIEFTPVKEIKTFLLKS